jgi:hypothetical protein
MNGKVDSARNGKEKTLNFMFLFSWLFWLFFVTKH